MAEITVSVKGGRRMKAVGSAVASAAALGYIAWHGGHTPSDAVELAVVAGYGNLTAFLTGSMRGSRHRRGKRAN